MHGMAVSKARQLAYAVKLGGLVVRDGTKGNVENEVAVVCARQKVGDEGERCVCQLSDMVCRLGSEPWCGRVPVTQGPALLFAIRRSTLPPIASI